MNKNGKTEIVMWILVGLLVVGLYYGFIKTPTTTTTTTPTNLIPADLITTITLNTKDALATTPTSADTGYYLFKSTGEFYKEGTTGSDGQDSVDVQYGGSYKLVVFNDSAGDGWLPEEKSFTADSDEGSVKTINMQLIRESGITIQDVRDPVDLNENISVSVGGTASFQILYKANVSNRGVLNPWIFLEGNQSGIDADGIKITTAGWTKKECPSRLTTAATRRLWCFNYEGVITSAMGLQTVDGSIKIHDTINPGIGAGAGGRTNVSVRMADSQMWREPDYIVLGYTDGLKKGAENAAASDVGQGDTVLGAADSFFVLDS